MMAVQVLSSRIDSLRLAKLGLSTSTIKGVVQVRHFEEHDFNCPCCGQNFMNEIFLDNLDDAREYAEIPFVVDSGYRCPKHNADIKGDPDSDHMRGLAADIACSDGTQRWQIVMGCVDAGIEYILFGKGHVHVSGNMNRPHPRIDIEKRVGML